MLKADYRQGLKPREQLESPCSNSAREDDGLNKGSNYEDWEWSQHGPVEAVKSDQFEDK